MNQTKEKLHDDQLQDSDPELNNQEILLDTPVNISVELGKTKITIQEFLKLSQGSMLILDKLIDEPLDIFMNNHLIASGKIVSSNDKYGLRITKIIRSLKNKNIFV